MIHKEKLQSIAANAGKTAKGIFNNAVQAIDQNNDGKFDLKDMSVIAGAVGSAAKKSAQNVKTTAEERAKSQELKTLRPIFPSTLDDANFQMSKFIRITERDKKHAESQVCQGSIGYFSTPKGLHMINLFQDSVDQFGLSFYPDNDSEFYYVDPSDRNKYIALDEYFSYLKVARINELQTIAQALGAKHFRVTYKEEQTTFSDKRINANGKGKASPTAQVTADAEKHSAERKYSTVEVAAEMTFPGHTPVTPHPVYLARDTCIQSLIAMRMDEAAPLLHQKYMLRLSNTSGIKERDAMKIDAVLNGLKCSGNTTVSSEVKNESRRYLEYEIEF